YHTTLAPQAIIVADTAPIRSGRSQDATELFVLHAGTRVDVQEQTENYAKIAFGKEMFGWIEQKNLGIL
ncbi:MAG: SH3 domain-containing protein, partial [Desulfoplanes sp.]|nr:SH3 domain-containing protein [Desulfoplanes sp.]